ncbi:MAG TPA: DUF6538 domain-containing protein [Afifellaceae bacterium]|nr:DUF6538 domain-containing protein [Afifellaceae bacterium]
MRRHLKAINGIWHYFRRVPRRFAHLDRRRFVCISLATRDLALAERKKPAIGAAVESYWIALAKGASPEARARYEGAIERARLEGFAWSSASDLAEGSVAELLARIEKLEALGLDDANAVDALLGTVSEPKLTLTAAQELWFEHSRDQLRGKSPDQVRRWKAPRMKAVGNLVQVVGDKPVQLLTRTDALAFRTWWLDRLEEESLTPNSANKDIGHLAQMLRTLDEAYQLGIGEPFRRLRLEEDKLAQRAAFSIDQLKAIIADGVLDGLNDEARGIVLLMVETGLRPVEICNLMPEDLALAHEVPHVKVTPRRERALKTPYSRREVPLVGVSLLAAEEFREGFPRYRDRSSQLSANVNKYLRGRGLLPTDNHSLYSIRHAFQDRLNAVDMPDRMQADLMGHKFGRPRYGSGPELAHKRQWLERIAIS